MWVARTTVFSGSHWAGCALSCWQRVLNLGGGRDSSPMRVVVGVPQGSILAPVLCSPYEDDAPTVPEVHLAIFADDTCVRATGRHEHHVLSGLQCSLTAVGSWCEH
jgi:hypothetical protein